MKSRMTGNKEVTISTKQKGAVYVLRKWERTAEDNPRKDQF